MIECERCESVQFGLEDNGEEIEVFCLNCHKVIGYLKTKEDVSYKT